MRSVAIGSFESRAPEPELGALVAEALRREVAEGTALGLAPAGTADAVVTGVVESVVDDPVGFRASSGRPLASARTTRATAVAFLRPTAGNAPRKVGPVSAEVERAALATDTGDAASRERAVRALAVSLAREIYRALVGGARP